MSTSKKCQEVLCVHYSPVFHIGHFYGVQNSGIFFLFLRAISSRSLHVLTKLGVIEFLFIRSSSTVKVADILVFPQRGEKPRKNVLHFIGTDISRKYRSLSRLHFLTEVKLWNILDSGLQVWSQYGIREESLWTQCCFWCSLVHSSLCRE